MHNLIKFEINELAERKGLLRACITFEFIILSLMFMLPSSAILTVTIVLSSFALGTILYANEITKMHGGNPGIDKRKLLLSFPITRREFAIRSVILYSCYVLVQAVFVVIAALLTALHNPEIVYVIPDLILGVLISGGAITGTMFIGSCINMVGILQIILSTLLLMPLLFYLGFLSGFTAKAGNLPSLWVSSLSLVFFLIGVLVEIVITPRID